MCERLSLHWPSEGSSCEWGKGWGGRGVLFGQMRGFFQDACRVMLPIAHVAPFGCLEHHGLYLSRAPLQASSLCCLCPYSGDPEALALCGLLLWTGGAWEQNRCRLPVLLP